MGALGLGRISNKSQDTGPSVRTNYRKGVSNGGTLNEGYIKGGYWEGGELHIEYMRRMQGPYMVAPLLRNCLRLRYPTYGTSSFWCGLP